MYGLTRSLGLLLLLGLSCAAFAVQPELYGRLPALKLPRLSPDGTKIAAIVSRNGDEELGWWPVGATVGDAAEAGLQGARLSGHRWIDNRYLVLSVARYRQLETRGYYKWVRFLVDTETGLTRPLLDDEQAGRAHLHLGTLVDPLPKKPGRLLIALDFDQPGYPGVYEMDVRTGELEEIESARPPILQWTTDQRGRVRVGQGYLEQQEVVLTKSSRRGYNLLLASDPLSRRRAFFWGVTSNSQLFVSGYYNGRLALFERRRSSARRGRLIFKHDRRDLEHVLFWPSTGKPAAASVLDGTQTQYPLDRKFRRIANQLGSLTGGTDFRVVDIAEDETAVLVQIGTASQPDVYAHFGTKSGTLSEIGRAYPHFGQKARYYSASVSLRMRDGSQINAIRSRPLAVEGPLPTVILPHGGPVSQSYQRFSSLIALLTDAGYQVIEPNFRGSSGFGYEFEAAGYNQWGGLMQQDIEDAARAVSALGWSSSQCIVGGSFGGYAALLAADKTELFQCAVALNPVTDVGLFAKNLRYNLLGFRALRRIEKSGGGDLAAVSPISQVDSVAVPVLLVHGKRDAQVSFDQSERYVRAMEAAGKSLQFLALETADHALVDEGGRTAYYEALIDFLHDHLAPRSELAQNGATGQ